MEKSRMISTKASQLAEVVEAMDALAQLWGQTRADVIRRLCARAPRILAAELRRQEDPEAVAQWYGQPPTPDASDDGEGPDDGDSGNL